VPFGFQPLDVSLKLAKSSIHMIRGSSAVWFHSELVDLAPSCLKGCLIVDGKLHRTRPAQTVGVRKIEVGFRPSPALRLAHGIRFAAKLRGHQKIKQRHILEITAAILGDRSRRIVPPASV